MSSLAAKSLDTSGATFYLFPKLPIELRLKIWVSAARQPRDVGVRAVIVKSGDNTKHAHFKSLSPVPSVLHASPESRNECLKIFVKCLPESLTTNRRIYINPHLDLLVVKTTSDIWEVRLDEWIRTKIHGSRIPKALSEIPLPDDSWAQHRGIWTIIEPRGKGNKDTVILVKMFEHHSVLKHNATINVRRHLMRLGYIEDWKKDKTYIRGFWAMSGWNQSWVGILREMERGQS